MFLEYLAHVRTLPTHKRRKRAVIISLLLTGVILLVWLSYLYAGRSSYLHTDNVENDGDVNRSVVRPDFSAATDGFLSKFDPEDTEEVAMPPVSPQETPQNAGEFLEGEGEALGGTSIESQPFRSNASSSASSSVETDFVEDILHEVESQ